MHFVFTYTYVSTLRHTNKIECRHTSTTLIESTQLIVHKTNQLYVRYVIYRQYICRYLCTYVYVGKCVAAMIYSRESAN